MTSNNDNKGVRIDFRVFFILTLLAAIPMLAGTWWLFSSYRQSYLGLAGERLSDAAETGHSLVDAYLQDRVMAMAGLTEVPLLRETIGRGNLDSRRTSRRFGSRYPRLRLSGRNSTANRHRSRQYSTTLLLSFCARTPR